MVIRDVNLNDAESICNIYNYYIANSICTFETDLVSPEEMSQRIIDVTNDAKWLVLEKNGNVAGYAYAKKWHQRAAYQYTLEASVYVSKDNIGKGYAYKLYNKLFTFLQTTNCHSLIALIALPNSKSIKLHETFGFYQSGLLQEAGYKFDKWIDIGFWSLKMKDLRING